MALGIAWVVATVFGFLSVYGWAFFLMVGQAHGPGLEIGLLAGIVAMLAVVSGLRLKQRERKQYKEMLGKIARQDQR